MRRERHGSGAALRRRACGRARAALLAAFLAAAAIGQATAATRLRISLIGGGAQPAAQTGASLAGLAGFLGKAGAGDCAVTVLPDAEAGAAVDGALRAADVAVIWVHGGTLGEAGRAAVLNFASAGRGIVVLGAAAGTWADWTGFESEILGARFGGAFAGGAPMRFVNLLPHPIFTGIHQFDTRQGMLQCELASDVQVVMEGTVGEDAVPMGWVRRYGRSRIICLEPGGGAILGDPDYRGIVLNGVRWAAARPIPGARTLVQRTYMNGAYPGALAIDLPGGPSLCYDTVRGGIDYIWDGDFADLHPWWTGKHGAPVRNFAANLSGPVLYREATLAQAMHVGARDAQSAYHFRGYRVKGDGYPELFYTVGGREITEDLDPVSDGVGVTRAFHAGPGEAPLWIRIEPDAGASIVAAGAVRDGDIIRFDSAAAGDFAVAIRKKEAFAPSR
jgi:Trehalose utilisation